jgi:hypothetical protein
MSNQDDEYMQNDYIEGELISDEEMIEVPENISSNINLQNLPNVEVYINNFINNNQQNLGDPNSTNNYQNNNSSNVNNNKNNNDNSSSNN